MTTAASKERIYKLTGKQSFVVIDDYASEPNLHFVKLLREESIEDKNLVLEGYFNDLYKLFLRKLADFDCSTCIDDGDKLRLKGLLDEMIRIKAMLGLAKREENL